MHLNGLCQSIVEIYEHGAMIVIASDGLVYNGIAPANVTRNISD